MDPETSEMLLAALAAYIKPENPEAGAAALEAIANIMGIEPARIMEMLGACRRRARFAGPVRNPRKCPSHGPTARFHSRTPLNASLATRNHFGAIAAAAMGPSSMMAKIRPFDETSALVLARWSWLRAHLGPAIH